MAVVVPWMPGTVVLWVPGRDSGCAMGARRSGGGAMGARQAWALHAASCRGTLLSPIHLRLGG